MSLILPMYFPEKKKQKRKTKKPMQKTTPNPSLPDDLLLSCFARISRLHYPSLSLASKSFSSLLSSPELYKIRSSLGRTPESCLYVCLRYGPNPNPKWFTLCLKPDQNLTKSSGNHVLAPISIHHHPAQANLKGVVNLKVVVAVGSNIYAIGGGRPNKNWSASNVWILDCQSHTWREAPSMLVKRSYPTVNVVDGKIYVAGGCKKFNSKDWMEVFDPKTQTWELVLNPLIEGCKSRTDRSAVIEGEIWMFGTEGVGYKPKEDRWQELGYEYLYLEYGWVSCYCAIDNVLYCYNNTHGLQWYDTSRRYWINLKSSKRLLKLTKYGHVRLVDYGGKMVVLWDRHIGYIHGYEIWCAVITLEKRINEEIREIWGKTEWLDVFLTVPGSYGFVCAVSASV